MRQEKHVFHLSMCLFDLCVCVWGWKGWGGGQLLKYSILKRRKKKKKSEIEANVGEKSLPQPEKKLTSHDPHMQADQKLSLQFKKTLEKLKRL